MHPNILPMRLRRRKPASQKLTTSILKKSKKPTATKSNNPTGNNQYTKPASLLTTDSISSLPVNQNTNQFTTGNKKTKATSRSNLSKLNQDNSTQTTNCKSTEHNSLKSEVCLTCQNTKNRRITGWQINTSLKPEEIQERKLAFLRYFYATGGKVADSCKDAGISTRQVYKWKSEDREFEGYWETVSEHRLDLAEEALDKLVASGNAASTIFMLKTLGKRRGYIERLQLETRSNKSKNLSPEEMQSEIDSIQISLDTLTANKKTPTLLLTSSQQNKLDKAASQDANMVAG